MRLDELDAKTRVILHDKVVILFRAQLPKVFGYVKTAMVEYFDERYATIAETPSATASTPMAATSSGAGRAFLYRDFDNTKPQTFNGVQDPIIAIMWLSDIEGCVFMYSCPANQKVRCALNLLRSGAKDWWRLVLGSCSDE